MNYLIDPTDLVFRAKGYIDGFNEMVKNEEIPQWDLLETATEIAEEWTNDWPQAAVSTTSSTSVCKKRQFGVRQAGSNH